MGSANSARRGLALAGRTAQVLVLVLALLVPAALAGLMTAVRRGRPAGWRHFYRRLTRLAIRLGPTFIKAGQVIGTRRDVLPVALCDELAVLADSVDAIGRVESRRGLEQAYPDDLDQLFSTITEQPIAAGSVACVYRGTLRSGQDVALKLRRPGVERVMTLDLTLMRRGAAFAAKLPTFRGMPVTDVVGSVCEAVLSQIDFVREADSLRRLRHNLSAVPRVWVPHVHAEISGPGCIVMEFIPDLDIHTAAACPPAMRRQFAASALTALYQMLFVDGFVHCDLHQGNLYFTRRGQVVVLDAGFSVWLTDRLRRLFAEFFLNMSLGRGRRCAEIVIESAAGFRPDADLDGFITAMAVLVERNHGLAAKDFSLIAFAGEMFDLQRKFGIHAASALVFPLLSLLVIEGTIRDLDPDADFQQTARPVLSRALFAAAR